jgi:hypothetical protein
LAFFNKIDLKRNEEEKRLYTYLKDKSNEIFQQEIDKWIKIAYDLRIVTNFQQRLSGKVTFMSLQAVLNELMVAYFMQTHIGMKIKQHSPPAKGSKQDDRLIGTNNQEVYVEVKTPWEEKREGTFWYSQYDKLFQTIDDGYDQRPENKKPYLICITDELNMTPALFPYEIEDALYGKRAIILSNYNKGQFKDSHYDVIDRRSIFQQNLRRGLSAVAIVKYMVWFNEEKRQDEGKYHFVLYHNPYCFEECRLNPDYFKSFRQYVPNYEKGEMEWRD